MKQQKHHIWEKTGGRQGNSWMAKTSSTFGAKWARKSQSFTIFTLSSEDTLFLKKGLIDRWCLKWNFAESNTKSDLLRNFMDGSLQSHDLHITISRMTDRWVFRQNFTDVHTVQCNFWPRWWPCEWPLSKFHKWMVLDSLISHIYKEKRKILGISSRKTAITRRIL